MEEPVGAVSNEQVQKLNHIVTDSTSSSSSSPGRSPVNLKDSIEELLRFTLDSYVQQQLNDDDVEGKNTISLSKDYCLKLLQHYSTHSITNGVEEVPLYPLYKRLAASLLDSISSGTICPTYNKATEIREDDSMKHKEDEWNKLISAEGSKLLNILQRVDFELHVQEPFFTQLKDGRKTVEGRCAVGDYNKIDAGALILVNKSLLLQVQEVRRYASFREMLQVESLMEVLPGVKTMEEGVQVYRNFYSEEKERLNGVVAIRITKPASQLCSGMFDILSGLGYEGVQRLLGFAHTVGTIPDALPPPTSTLLSSFSLRHNLDVKGSKLTDGARALAKHANRSSDNYWGTFSGSDIYKNKLAMDVIIRLMNQCCWMNIHIVRPHGIVFEIRDAGGYGARWSGDGTKFIGFLEPYMVDGHSKGWKH